MFSFKVDIDALRLRDRFDSRTQRAQAYLDSEVLRHMRPYVPFVQGTLANTAVIERPGRITFVQPYARRLYYGVDFDFTTTFHKKAGPKWADRAKAAHLNDWRAGVERILKGGNG